MKKFLIAITAVLALFAFAIPSFAAPAKSITVTWSEDSTSVDVTSDKDLSNVVLEDCLGVHYKHDGLKKKKGTFEHPSGLAITTVWVKSGNNQSGDGPGYGERFDNPDEAVCEVACEITDTCETTTTTKPEETTTTTVAETTTTTMAVTTTTQLAAPRTLSTPPPAAPAPEVQGITETLPRTGSSTAPLLLAGALAIAVGGTAMLATRRRRSTDRAVRIKDLS